MIKLYFGNVTTIISTLTIIGFAIFFGYTIARRESINNWGLLVLVLFFIGLFMSIMSGSKDGMGTSASIFAVGGPIFIMLSILGGLAFLIAIATIFIKKQDFWQVSFYAISTIIIIKTIVVEVSRIILMLKK